VNLRLLGDLRTVFLNDLMAVAQATSHGLPTKTIVEELYALDEAPWHTVNKGEAYTPSQLASTLRDYEVRSENLRPHPNVRTQAKGYPIAALADAWRRYLPPLSLPPDAVPNVTMVTRDVYERFFEVVVTPVAVVTPSQRTKDALAAAKERGVELGNPNLGKMVTATTAARDAILKPILQEMWEMPLRDIAAELTARNIPTPRGGDAWSPMTVMRAMKRLGIAGR
jgi:hypothetical protein